jgi:membrane protein YqaA with SNARE-associated domain
MASRRSGKAHLEGYGLQVVGCGRLENVQNIYDRTHGLRAGELRMPDLSPWVVAYGLWGLALVAFLAATLVPLSSEVAVATALQLGLSPLDILLWASMGNCLGAMTNYCLGLLCTRPVLARVQRERWGRQALAWAERYGGWSLATSWLPGIGDPIMLIGGVLQVHLGYVLLLGLGTRVARYLLLIGLLGE